MRVLLDEGVPKKLKWRFSADHSVTTVRDHGWAGTRNGKLLRASQAEFDALVTVDKRMRFQQNVAALDLCVIVFDTRGTTYEDLLPFMPEVEEALRNCRPGRLIMVPTR